MGHKKNGLKHIQAITGAIIKDIIPDDSIPPGEVAFKVLLLLLRTSIDNELI